MIIFSNEGVIDRRVITTFGVNVKVNDNPIGHFGTGLKYAIAVILRNGLAISIYAGEEELEFASETNEIRGEEFDIVTMNGEPLPFTTELGKDWELWEAFRELYSNCMDEGGCVDALDDVLDSAEKTHVLVDGQEFDDLYANLGDMFIADADETLVCTASGDAYNGTSDAVFYRGIRVNKYKKPYMHKYNIQEPLELTENRTAKYQFAVDRAVCNIIALSDDKEFIRDALTAPKECAEAFINFEFASVKPSEAFKDVMAQLRFEKKTCNSTAGAYYSASSNLLSRILRYVMTASQETIFHKKVDALRDFTGLEFDDIEIVETLGDDFALANDETVYVSKKLLEDEDKVLYSHLIQAELNKWDDDETEQRNALLQMIVHKI